ncbi:hypothetical protein ECE50_004670 [Chitinophaga sp. Mgbs1]|uniref:Uncharacterized protein n=1 Tax=Chitinophaga solisilvae TaxID=1233460 RepID=A0A433WG72_9BACT|nr:hypothetical protein [Chitinophaga solisilvae]
MMLIKAALNGTRTLQDHPQVPVTTHALVTAAREAVAAGAGAIHFHVRDSGGRESLHPDDVNSQVQAMKHALPGIPVGISTGAWIVPELALRLEYIEQWMVLPDFVSVNGDEAGFEQVADKMLQRGIGVEAGISSEAAVLNFKRSGRLPHCFRLLLEPGEQEMAAALHTAAAIEQHLTDKLPGQSVLLHGSDLTCWPLLKMAISKGYDLRIGFEDTLLHPSGIPAADNAELVQTAMLYKNGNL